jgi:LacI family transcriptional regulator
VRAAALELGYRPDMAARGLRTRRSGTVGVVVPDLANPVIPPIVRGVEETLWSAGMACLLADTDNDVAREAALIDELRSRRCEGLVIASAARLSRAVEALAREDVATVLVTRGIDSGALPLVAADDAAGVRAAVAHLRALGHTRIAHVTGPEELSTTTRREAAFREAVAGDEGGGAAAASRRAAGAPLVVHGEAFTVAAGERAAASLLAAHPDVTAIVAGNDMIALGCYAALAAAGLRCPGDVSVTGHNDMPFVAQAQPPLTTVAIPARELGVQAARLLLARLRGEAVESVRLPTRLILRASTAAPARA